MQSQGSMTHAMLTIAKTGTAALVIIISQPAVAAFPLRIFNTDSQPITITISNENYNCYEGDPPIGNSFNNVQPGEYKTIMLSRVQGHGCDGRQGEFELVFSPGYNGYTVQHFDFDNDGGLELSSGHPNVYPGRLTRSPDGSYTYFTARHAEITASAPAAGWALICQSICARSISYQLITTRSTEKRTSEQTRTAIEAALKSSLKFEGVGGIEGSLKTTRERTIGAEMAETLSRAESNTDTFTFNFDSSQMKAPNIFAVWQWTATTKLSDGNVATVRSNKFTCTPDGQAPNYFPGSAEDVRACRGG